MKTWASLVLVSLCFGSMAQLPGLELGGGYTFAAPMNTMKRNIRQGHGITLDGYISPFRNPRVSVGLDMNYTIYGTDQSRQEYTFDDGTVAPMDIIVNNSFLNFMGAFRYYLSAPGTKALTPYVNLRGGYSWFRTSVNIYDPDDDDHCAPIERDLLMKDGTFSISGGAGLHWDLSTVFKHTPHNTFLFNISTNLTLGGEVSYMNTDGPDPGAHHSPTDVTARFINNNTQVVHAHHVGYLYRSFVEMVEVRAGFIWRIQPPGF